MSGLSPQAVVLISCIWCRLEGKPGPQNPSQEVFLAFGRVFSGMLKEGQSMHVLSAAYNPMQPHLQRQIIKVRETNC